MQAVRRNGGPGYHTPARFVASVLVSVLVACAPPNGGESAGRSGQADTSAAPDTEDSMPKTIEDVLAARTPELMQKPGVIGVGQGLCEDRPCIRVYVANDSVGRTLPDSLDGYAVSPVVTGQVRTQPPPPR